MSVVPLLTKPTVTPCDVAGCYAKNPNVICGVACRCMCHTETVQDNDTQTDEESTT